MALTPDILILIIKSLCWIIGTIIALFASVVGILHKGMIKRLDLIELDIKPLVTQVALHSEQIKEIKDDQAEMNKWLNHHDSEIQKINRIIKAA
jgi:hypothetical protein